ncbi:hypothetical protein MHK_000693, partial [Candidatus Magnetomorum sp. HK-1]
THKTNIQDFKIERKKKMKKIENKINTFQFMIDNRKVIIETIKENLSIPKAWDQLKGKLPATQKVVKFNTFKGYVKALNVVNHIMNEKDEILRDKQKLSEEIGIVRQEKKELEIKLGKVRQDYSENLVQLSIIKEQRKSLELELNQVRQKLPNQKSITVPKQVDGWGVQLKGNYYRLFKKISGKVKWIHIGRKWNLDLAEKKIKDYNG